MPRSATAQASAAATAPVSMATRSPDAIVCPPRSTAPAIAGSSAAPMAAPIWRVVDLIVAGVTAQHPRT